MSIKTQVIWSSGRPQEVTDAVTAKANAMAAQQTAPMEGGTNPDGTEFIVYRFWVDEISATEWIDFVNGYDPISASIIPN